MLQFIRKVVFFGAAGCALLLIRKNFDNKKSENECNAKISVLKNEDDTGDPSYAIKRVYELALKQREFEIAQLTQRNNFFMIFQGVLIGGLVQSQGTAAPLINFLVCMIGMCISICQVGMAGGAKFWQIRWEVAVKELELRLFEAMKSSPRKMIQLFTIDDSHLTTSDKERIYAINLDKARDKDKLKYAKGEVYKLVHDDLNKEDLELKWWSGWLNGERLHKRLILKRYSVSRIPLSVGIFLLVFWSLLWLKTFAIFGHSPIYWATVLIPKELFQLQGFK